MADQPRRRSSWRSPAAIAAVAALVTATTTVVALVRGSDPRPATAPAAIVQPAEPTLADWVAQANVICAEASDELDALTFPDDDRAQALEVVREILHVMARLDHQLQALDRPKDFSSRIAAAIGFMSEAQIAMRGAYDSFVDADDDEAQRRADEASRLVDLWQDAYADLGADVCAQALS